MVLGTDDFGFGEQVDSIGLCLHTGKNTLVKHINVLEIRKNVLYFCRVVNEKCYTKVRHKIVLFHFRQNC